MYIYIVRLSIEKFGNVVHVFPFPFDVRSEDTFKTLLLYTNHFSARRFRMSLGVVSESLGHEAKDTTIHTDVNFT
jgi:hypothetical protein